MRVLLSWLRELVAIEADVGEIARRLTMAGLEVEAIERLDRGLEQVVVGEVRAREPVEGTKLSVCRVFDGSHELQIVCGAQNYGVGDHVPLAQVGATLPDGKAIGRAKLRGIESFGMLCAARELGLSQDSDGLLILPRDTKPGTPIAKVVGRDDVALEINVTPNRPDALSHIGVARELAALFGVPLRTPAIRALPEEGSSAPVDIQAGDLCHRYAARVLEGVKVGPSPAWLSSRLEALGQRSINNVVDATNYVMLERGQPLHAFDLDRLAQGRIVVRRAKDGEKITTLDGKERALTGEELVIADATNPVAIAGVMGGEDSEVKEHTTRLLLESAYFLPGSVRRTARRHGLHSEASHRFERGVDPEGIRAALDRLAELILESAGGQVLGGVTDVVATPFERPRVRLRHARVEEVLGTAPEWSVSVERLESLGLKAVDRGTDAAVFEVPGFRPDLATEIDLVEEVARIGGLNAITPVPLPGHGIQPAETDLAEAQRRLRCTLIAAGFDETVNFAFDAREELHRLRPGVEPIALKNPLASDHSVMRTTLLPGLLRNLRHNLRRGVDAIRLYEMGRTYLPLTEAPSVPEGDYRFEVAEEPLRLSLVAAGPRASGWTGGRDAYDFFDLKGAVEQLLETLGLTEATFEPARDRAHLHPRSGAAVRLGERELGTLGELHPVIADAMELPRGVLVAELDGNALLECARLLPDYHGVPRFPAVLRDLAFVVDESVTAAAVAREIAAADPAGLVEEATLFDVYRGAPLPPDRKNLAYSLSFRAKDRTLTDEDVNALHAAIVERLKAQLGADLRG